jgi:alpha-N-arabinofuranosidase
MKKLGRREFIGKAAVGLAGAALISPRTTRAATASIEILLNETIGTISPNLYGHFVEHLGGVVYDGIWVGEDSKIPNTGGIRNSVIEAMRRIKAPVIRYPGGCFADSYDWRDGIGDRAKRPRRTNFWYGNNPKSVPEDSLSRYEPNRFGTNEFNRFCQLTGAKPYLAANLRGMTAQDLNSWLEYCNSPAGSTTWAAQRAAGSAGSREPFNVEFWGVGNESWGCGGELLPDEYAQEFRRFTAVYNGYGVPVKFIGAGASSDDINWTRGFFARMREKGEGSFRRLYGWGIHHYTWNLSGGRTRDWNDGKRDALQFDAEQYYEALVEADKLENYILQHWGVMGEYDTRHQARIVVDEWGTWYKPGTELKPEHLLGQQNTMRDALIAGLTLNLFNRHADKVMMGNIAQLANCLQSLFFTDGDKFTLTPTYHAFEMFTPHMGAQAVRAVFIAPKVGYERNGKPAEVWGLNGSASVNGKVVTLTVTNSNLTEPVEAAINIRGARIASASARTLSASDVHAHNTFAEPNAVTPRDHTMDTGNSFRFAPASVTRLSLTLA